MPVKLPVGQMARAARTHCPHFRFEMVMDPPSDLGLSSNLAEPDRPVVSAGAPSQPVEEPAMLPQMESWATFSSWKTILLDGMHQHMWLLYIQHGES